MLRREQISKQLTKGGPGSGRYPLGSGNSNSIENNVKGKIKTEEGTKYLYHVTATENVPNIQKKGLTVFNPSNWVEAGSKARLGDAKIYAFENQTDAVKWASKMDWEFNKDMGTGKISVVRLKDTGDWGIDTNDPLGQAMASGKWLNRVGPVKAEHIDTSVAIRPEHVKRLVGMNADINDLFSTTKMVKGGPGSGRYPAGSGSDEKSFNSPEEKQAWDTAHKEAMDAGLSAEQAVDHANQKSGDVEPFKIPEFKNTDAALVYGKSIEGDKAKIDALKTAYESKRAELKTIGSMETLSDAERSSAFVMAQKNQLLREAYETAEKKVMGKWVKGGVGSGRYPKGSGETIENKTEDSDLKEFNNILSQFQNNEKLLDSSPELKGKGNEVARRTLSVFGGNDLTFKARSSLKEMGYILQDRPELIRLVSKEDAPLILEFMKQNQGTAYGKIKSAWESSTQKMTKGGPESGNHGHAGRPGVVGGSGEGGADAPKETPRLRAYGDAEKDKFYVRVNSGDFGSDAQVKILNGKIGEAEGRIRAYKIRAGKMAEGEKDDKGRDKDTLLRMAHNLGKQSEEFASMRDSLLGRPAQKMIKREIAEKDIILMIDNGEFESLIKKEIDQLEENGGL